MTTAGLFHKEFAGREGAQPLVILHGLLGSSRNWQTVGRELANHARVFAVDLRNHGASAREEGMGYEELARDLAGWLDSQGLDRVHLMGHSMGGKTAMRFAMDFPERLLSLTVVDIAPRDYGYHHRKEFAAMIALDLSAVADRRGAEDSLAATVEDWAMRQFLLTNLSRKDDGTWSWDINLAELARELPTIASNPLRKGDRFDGRTLFITGGKSDFVRPEDRCAILEAFPAAELFSLPESGHNPHMESRSAFVSAVANRLFQAS